ncbi:glycosyltransferase family 2 protein [uncultured Oscillibacter sp.]|uniref:glycosyltransferase family 2 protein n=1 Tax=uncultured Oscillibacter sp. TaxID=876091 RepID=UPI0025D33F71|nr:glycosyltransferase family 2 protein [uncultured Oscillibacter sp.]
MKVIVFTQAYNAEQTLSRAISSILDQTFQNIEYYILDNGSTDRTWDIILDYAKRDPRVIPLSIKKNDIENGWSFFCALEWASNAEYSVWLDADDAYDRHFLEEMTRFAQENALDIAMCGYDMIDGVTGRTIKCRALEKNLVLSGKDFADKFIEYRGFTNAGWGRLYALSFFKTFSRKNQNVSKSDYSPYGDSAYQLCLLENAERAGVYRKAMYRYYQYPHSLIRQDLKENLKGYAGYIVAARQYLEHYGPISKGNEDFLYAIYLSFADESAEHAFSSDLSVSEKLELLRLTFSEPLWAETLAREADPQFRNLAARREYVTRMKERILALASTPEEQELAEKAVRELDKPIASGPTQRCGEGTVWAHRVQ